MSDAPIDSDDERGEIPFKLPHAERLAINAVSELTPTKVVCLSVGRGQCAAAIADAHPGATVECCFIEAFAAWECDDYLAIDRENMNVHCRPDLPEGEIDLFVLPLAKGGESLLARDWLQQGYDRLKPGGILVASIDNKRDKWLHKEVEKFGKNLTRLQKKHGVAYRLVKKKPLKKLKNYDYEFAFRDSERLIKAISRPGVFSHRRLDLGARALMEVMEVHPGDKVIDIGCGAGVVGHAAAMREENVTVVGLDANARAVECFLRGAELNHIERVSGVLSAEGDLPDPGTYDLAVGNPPYYSHFAIAEIFLQAAKTALKPGGRVYIVSKQTEWLVARMEQLFDEIELTEQRTYSVVKGIARES